MGRTDGMAGWGYRLAEAGGKGLFTTVFLSDKDGFEYPQEESADGVGDAGRE